MGGEPLSEPQVAPPASKAPGRLPSSNGWTALVLIASLIVLAALVPVPYVVLAPGPVTDTLGSVNKQPLITITGRRTYPTEGRLDLTTVSVSGGPQSPLQLGRAVTAWFDRRYAVVPESLVYPPDADEQEVEEQNAQEMTDSQQQATSAALRSLRIPVSTSVVVQTTIEGLPARGVLEAGDVIRSVNGAPVAAAQVLRERIRPLPVGSTVKLGIVRDGRPTTLTLRTAADPDDDTRSAVGVATREEHDYPFDVAIKLDDVGGPSAGLMFALGIVDKLTPGALTGGRHIAGTGAIDGDGSVRRIGGIQQKVRAASEEGASVFLTPAANCPNARAVRPAGLRLIEVEKLSDAVASLEALRTGKGDVPEC